MDDARIDKWLWAARFFKTRALAADAVAGGKVTLDGTHVKPAKAVRIGAVLTIRRGDVDTTVIVARLSLTRRPAPEAALLYEETAASVAARAAAVERRREDAASRPRPSGRPTKKARRDGLRLTRGF